jgi:hypothetical protein
MSRLGAVVLAGWAITGCNPPAAPDGSCDPAASSCVQDQVCDLTEDGGGICVAPVQIIGAVLGLADDAPIEGARVQAVDANGAAVGTTGTTSADGGFLITVPAVRELDGSPIEGNYTLRAQAHAHQEFPTALRPALPIDVTSAVADEAGSTWVLEVPQSTVKLIALQGDSSTLGSISGSVSGDENAGVLLVAEPAGESAGEAFTGFSDSSGDYVIFNVPSGSYSVQAYTAGAQWDETAATLGAGEQLSDVDLTASDRALNSLDGSIQIVNAGGGSLTSVVLAVESTFNESAARGTVPPGLRAGNIDGAFAIDEIPDGRYVVLAAFENDDLVRDPDQNIGGTAIVRITLPDEVQGTMVSISEGFKVTGALAVIEPGADEPQEVLSEQPQLVWEDDSSEDGYTVRVFDAFGNVVWNTDVAAVSGSSTVSDLCRSDARGRHAVPVQGAVIP